MLVGELAAGIAEIVKYGLIVDPPLFRWLETHMERLLALESAALTRVGSIRPPSCPLESSSWNSPLVAPGFQVPRSMPACTSS